jgi:hypothetical protein
MKVRKLILKLILILGLFMIGFASCSKTETDFTGDLSINITNSTSNPISDFYINIYDDDSNGTLLITSGVPDAKGNYKVNLLFGTYSVDVGYPGHGYGPPGKVQSQSVQIKGSGKTSNLIFNF